MRLCISLLACVLLVPALAGCGFALSGSGSEQAGLLPPIRFRIEASDYAFTFADKVLSSGEVEFDTVNTGARPHELLVVPVENGRYGLPVLHIELPDPGSAEIVTASLAPGSYLFVCLLQVETTGGLISHVDLGMSAEVEVEG